MYKVLDNNVTDGLAGESGSSLFGNARACFLTLWLNKQIVAIAVEPLHCLL